MDEPFDEADSPRPKRTRKRVTPPPPAAAPAFAAAPAAANPFAAAGGAMAFANPNPFAQDGYAVADDAAPGTYTYTLIKSGPDVDPDDVRRALQIDLCRPRGRTREQREEHEDGDPPGHVRTLPVVASHGISTSWTRIATERRAT